MPKEAVEHLLFAEIPGLSVGPSNVRNHVYLNLPDPIEVGQDRQVPEWSWRQRQPSRQHCSLHRGVARNLFRAFIGRTTLSLLGLWNLGE
jgi:hypothetical protein